MRILVMLILGILPIICFSQVVVPSNIYFTANEIKGNADPNTVVKIDRNAGGPLNLAIITVAVNTDGYFSYVFESTLVAVGANPQPIVSVWAEDIAGVTSTINNYTALTTVNALQNILNGTLVLPTNRRNPQIEGLQNPSTSFRYKIKMFNTNFTVPLARFNLVRGSESKAGDILLFNSVGAGIGVSWGEVEKTTDATGTTINTEFTNTFGIHLGILFSSGKDGVEQKNIFAPTLSFSFLDFQLGTGYELGSIADKQKKVFVTLNYAIPFSKLVKGKFYVFTASPGFNSLNPLPNIPSSNKKLSKHRLI